MEKINQVVQLLKHTKIGNILSNKDLFTYILSFLTLRELKQISRNITVDVHSIIVPRVNVLLYGQVQSGKTGKIIEYINNFNPEMLKILVIQNSKTMLSQYCKTLKNNNIDYVKIESSAKPQTYNNEKVLITIHNKNRMASLNNYIKHNMIVSTKYCLILDESDQYFDAIKDNKIYKDAKNVLHVTATPFKFSKETVSLKINDNYGNNGIDKVIAIKPKDSYYGIQNIEFKQIELYKPKKQNREPGDLSAWRKRQFKKICKIINDDFMSTERGFMLITCYNYVLSMYNNGLKLSRKFPNAKVIVASSESYIFVNGKETHVTISNMQTFINQFNDDSHLIIIANRMANRGVNYTNCEYSRNITHQITIGGNCTTFMQKCRIFGNRTDMSVKPKVYCFIQDKVFDNFVIKLKELINNMINSVKNPSKRSGLKMTELKQLCKSNRIKRYSGLNKQQLIDLLIQHNLLL